MSAVFDWAESPGTGKDRVVRLLETQFGDGYVQVAPDGLNAISTDWHLSFRDCDNAVANDIETFLIENAGLFIDWMPLWSTSVIKVICKGWRRTQGERWGTSDMSVEFKRVYVP